MCSVKDTGITPGLEPTSKCGAAKLKVPMILTLEPGAALFYHT